MAGVFDSYLVPDLQKYLRDRGVTVTGYNKLLLKSLAIAVHQLQLPDDPDFSKDDISITSKLNKIGLSADCNPLTIDGYTFDFTDIPDFGLIDIFNYLIFKKADFDGKKLKAFKSFEDYRLFNDGHVHQLKFNPINKDSKVCLFSAKVKPTQRDSTYLNKEFYDLWFALDKTDGYVITGHCECKGGADGACRHFAAALYELEAFEKVSCTEGENLWTKRPTSHDIPVPMASLSVVRPKYRISDIAEEKVLPTIDAYDPRHIDQRQTSTVEHKREFGKELQELSTNIQALDILLEEEDRLDGKSEIDADLLQLSILNKAKQFVENCDKICTPNLIMDNFLDSLVYSDEDISAIQEGTTGQSENKLWFAMRVGLLTASNFQKAVDYVDTSRKPAPSFISSIFGENRLDEESLPAPLKWGRRKEQVAREMFTKVNRKYHIRLRTEAPGLLISKQYPYLGCSADGICKCNCKPPHQNKLVEIKCPYSLRDSEPKEVAELKNCFFNRSVGRWEANEKCPYYAQIQGQLGLYNLQECDLVIYTKKGIHVSTVLFNEQYFLEMIKKLVFFHKKYLLNTLIEKYLC